MKEILTQWPLTVVCVAMVVAAVIDGWKLKVPNVLTYPLIVSGWLLGLCYSLGWIASPNPGSGIGAALAGTALGFVLLLPVYSVGGMGAGDVKMQMGFGSWVGAYYGATAGLWIIWWAFAIAVIVGGVIALGMILLRGKLQENMANTREILNDLMKGSAEQASEAAGKRKPRMHLLPYGIPLCIGFVGYLVYINGF